jgi:mono/diheme cytochrome c family protein
MRSKTALNLNGIFLLSVIVSFVACSNDSKDAPENPDVARGRAVFVANCIACHNNDPSKDGPIGPAIKGSARELIEARVLSTTYPTNYKPKRPTKVMPQFPFLKDDIPYLAAYLK